MEWREEIDGEWSTKAPRLTIEAVKSAFSFPEDVAILLISCYFEGEVSKPQLNLAVMIVVDAETVV